MKNLFLLIGIAGALAMASCGGDKKEDKKEESKGMSVCDCWESEVFLMEEAIKAETDEERMDIAKRAEEVANLCKGYTAEEKAACGQSN